MTVYADTNFYTNLLVELPQSGLADALLSVYLEDGSPPLPVPQILCVEVINAFQRLVFEARHGTRKIHITPEWALMAEERLFDGLERRTKWELCEPDSKLLLKTFTGIVHRHTARHGFRTYDVLHVASALVLGCDTFWSFDGKAKKLAALEGLATN